jgi:hypothetical protein
VHNVSAHKKLSITCLYSHTDMPSISARHHTLYECQVQRTQTTFW